MRPIYLVDDGRGLLSPLTDLRPVFDVRTGALTLVGRLAAAGELQVIGVFVPDALADLTRERHTVSVNPVLERNREFIAVNARCPMVRGAEVQRLTKVGMAIVHETSGELVAASLTPDLFPAMIAGTPQLSGSRKSGTRSCSGRSPAPGTSEGRRDTLLRYDLSLLMNTMSGGAAGEAGADAHVSATAKVHESAVFDTEMGPVYLADHAVVRPGRSCAAPADVGPHSTVLDRAVIRPNTTIGPIAKWPARWPA
jgi:hypothetical protein